MQIGEPSYKKCPHCGKKNEYYKGPFFIHYYGLTEWSDGKTFEELPSLKKSKLQKCDSCNQFYWFARKMGGMSFDDYVEAAAYFEEKYLKLSLTNLIHWLRNKQRLIYIRLNILRTYNDQIRIHPLSNDYIQREPIPDEKKEIFIKNAKRLIKFLVSVNSDDYFLIAELYRNLGEFEKAKEVLNKLTNSDKKELLLREIELKNRDVVTIQQPMIIR